MTSADQEQFQEQLSAYLDGELSGVEAAEVERRLESDPEARVALESLRRTVELVRALPHHTAPIGVMGDLTAAAEREQLLVSGTGANAETQFHWENIGSLLATAAVVVITVGAALWYAVPRSGLTGMADPHPQWVEADAHDSSPSDTARPRASTQGAESPAPPTMAMKKSDPESDFTPPAKSVRQEALTPAPAPVQQGTRSAAERSAGLAGADPRLGLLFKAMPAITESSIDPTPTRADLSMVGKDGPISESVAAIVEDDSLVHVTSETADTAALPNEHVIPLSFVCLDKAQAQGCRVRLDRYIESREPTKKGRTVSVPDVEDMRLGSPLLDTMGPLDALLDRRHGSGRVRQIMSDGQATAPEASHLDVTIAPAEYRVRIPASELLNLIDEVASVGGAEVVAELKLGPFVARGRSRIEMLVADSGFGRNLAAAGEFDEDAEPVQRFAKAASPSPSPALVGGAFVETKPADVTSAGEAHRSAGKSGRAAPARSKSADRVPAEGTGRGQRQETEPPSDVARPLASPTETEPAAEPNVPTERESLGQAELEAVPPAASTGFKDELRANTGTATVTDAESAGGETASGPWITLIITVLDQMEATSTAPPRRDPLDTAGDDVDRTDPATPIDATGANAADADRNSVDDAEDSSDTAGGARR